MLRPASGKKNYDKSNPPPTPASSTPTDKKMMIVGDPPVLQDGSAVLSPTVPQSDKPKASPPPAMDISSSLKPEKK